MDRVPLYSWYCLRTHNKMEDTAARRIRNQGFNAYVPKYPAPSTARSRRRRDAPRWTLLFPGYVFVQIAPGQRWQPLRSTPGVAGFLTHTLENGIQMPSPLPRDAIEVMNILAAGLITPEDEVSEYDRLQEGQAVRITSGPFTSFCATYIELLGQTNDGHRRVAIMVEIFGRLSRIEVDRSSIVALPVRR